MKKLLFVVTLIALAVSARAQDVVFIAHPASAETGLDATAIKDILLGNITKWPHGPALKLAILAEGPLHAKIVKDYTQRTTEQFEKFWKRKVFTGAGIMPAQFQNEEEVIAFVASNPGAFGYVSSASLTNTDKVKVLSTD